MKLFKVIVVMSALMMFTLPAWAGNTPEFDAVGCDSLNFFALAGFAQYQPVIANNANGFGQLINQWSDFAAESFNQRAGQLAPDPCFPILSALTDAWNEGTYTWRIVLQMKPESDLNINITDCVLKHNEFNIFGGAEQTGRYRADTGQLFFVPSANPRITARALPGPFATPNFVAPFFLDARVIPGGLSAANVVSLEEQLYTSKAHWTEGIVVKLPQTGMTNAADETEYNLKQGDVIEVSVAVPFNNSVDLRYGQESVIIKYIGIVFTEYVAPFQCDIPQNGEASL
jgi:hypothetical protein